MKYLLYCCLIVTGLSVLSACSNGDYVANPGNTANGGINPLNPLTKSQFTWTGTDPVSGYINGTPWVASGYNYAFDSGQNIIYGYNGSHAITLYLKDLYQGNLYSMGYAQYNSSATWTDSVEGDGTHYYASVLGNSGELYLLENDSVRLKGLFYFQGVNSVGTVVNITNGYFNITK